jgi:NHL repeat
MRPRLPVLLAVLLSLPVSAQTVRTIAGIPGVSGTQDGNVREATFFRPTWLDVDRWANAIYVVDRANQTVRKIQNGVVSTTLVHKSVDPNSATHDFRFGGPAGGGIAVEPYLSGCGFGPYSHGMYVSGTAEHRVVFVSGLDFAWQMYAYRDDVVAFIGNGEPGATDGNYPEARMNAPGDVALSWRYRGYPPHSFVYIADTGNHTIRYIQMSLSFESCPQPRTLRTLAGKAGQPGSADGDAATARFRSPRGIAAGPDGSVYVADTDNHTIRRIAPDGTVTTIAGAAGAAGFKDGIGSDARLRSPMGIDVNAMGDVFIADTGNHVIRKLSPNGMLTTIAGAPEEAGFADGPANEARFSAPVGIRILGEKLLIADTSNEVIREYDPEPPQTHRRAVRK